MREANKLTPRRIAGLDKPGRYGDGRGLWLQISKWGTKAWLFRYSTGTTKISKSGKSYVETREMGLGPVSLKRNDGGVTLAEARAEADRLTKLVRQRIDPIQARDDARMAARIEAASGITFQEAAERFIAAHKPTWKNDKHKAQWTATLEGYAYPVIGSLPVSAVDVGLVLKVLEPIWLTKTETATRIRSRIERVLDWATARGYRQGDNPARWKGHLDKLLPARPKAKRVRNHPALPYADLPAFMADLRTREGTSGRALEFTILTTARTSETIGARWPEIDTEAKIWTVPAERMKADREHRVPLSDRALEILKALPREGSFVFPGAKEKQPLSNMAMLELLRGMRDGLTVHGFRSTFKDWAAETTNYPREVSEAALAHVVGDKVEAAYRRGDLFEKRRRLMREWARYCAAPATKPRAKGEVLPLHGAA